MPVDLTKLNEGWLELESDPGLFTLLLEDFGVKGVQVEEIYDLQKPLVEGPVYGFIFLFKWIEERRSRRKIVVADETFVDNEDIINSMFFAQQMIPNSCATHALLSVLLNCDKIHLGETLSRLKLFTTNMSPENKGYAIGNVPELAKAHNSHAKPEPRHLPEKSHGISTGRTMEAFHFVSYVPINGRLFELDGLKPSPIDHGPWNECENWTEKFRRAITERLGIATGGEPYHDIRFNLMAVVTDRRQAYEHKLNTLKTNRQIVLEALQHLVQMTHPDLTSQDKAQYMAAVRKNRNKLETPLSQDGDNHEIQNGPSDSGTPPGRTRLRHRNSAFFHKLPAALDTHNYAKTPLMEGHEDDEIEVFSHSDIDSESEYLSAEDCPPCSDQHQTGKVLENGINSNSSSNLSIPDSKNTKKFDCNKKTTISAASLSAELTKPLTIQTKFEVSPAPSSESTDTSSEVGSAFNSPVLSANHSLQNSPNSARINKFSSDDPSSVNTKDIKKFVVIKVSSGRNSENQDASTEKRVVQTTDGNNVDVLAVENKVNGKRPATENAESAPSPKKLAEDDTPQDYKTVDNNNALAIDNKKNISIKEEREKKTEGNNIKASTKLPNCKYPQLSGHHAFAPKDLLALLKNVENEIAICESNLREEYEKRRKYKVDDCRRTHNYDQFICTFLSMLAEQGHLANLVEQHMLIRRRQGITIGQLHRTRKPDRRRRARPKKKK